MGYRRPSDITLADFWGIQKEFPDLDDDKGTSFVVVHSPKGKNLIEKLKGCLVKEIPLEVGTKHNPSYYTACKKPKGRNSFFDSLTKVESEEKDFVWLYKKYGIDSLPQRVYVFTRRCGGKVLRILGLRK